MAPISRLEAKRLAAAARALADATPPLPETHQSYLDDYVPASIAPELWAAVASVHNDIMSRSRIDGLESFKKRSRELASYLAARAADGQSIAVTESMTFAAIDEDYRLRSSHLSAGTKNTRRSRLRNLALAVNPGLDAPPGPPTLGYQGIRAPYSRGDELAIQRIARRQRNLTARRRLCAVVGLCGGAGLDSVDLRELRGRHIDDRGDDGIFIDIPGTRPRQVAARREYEQLIRIGIEATRPGELVLGKSVTRRNIVGNIVRTAEIMPSAPHIEASRLRATWLAWLMTRPVPLSLILDAAGLKSTRSLTGLIPHITTVGDPSALRGEITDR